jgi:prepilin-type N-terminal cleavage/methylation domain-containing protein
VRILLARNGRRRARQEGFTLVEIASVLVVVGLLLGAIFKGEELITQARVKNVIADFSSVSVAYHGYFDRYTALPGDDRNAATRWAAAPAATSGDGNGQVAGTYNNGNALCAAGVESCSWWDHLRRAGFVTGSGATLPLNAAGGLMGVQTGDGTGPTYGPVLGGPAGAGGFASLILCSANLPEKIATAVDVQLDDGARVAGTVRGMLQSAPNPTIAVDATAPAAGGASSYLETGTSVYTLCRAMQAP